MTALSIKLDGDGVWPDLLKPGARVEWLRGGGEMAALAAGTVGGKPTIALRLDLPDGQVVVWQTTLRLLVVAARAFVARYGDPTVGEA